MLAYRHAFHAGNHGDVLKHLVLLAVLRHLNLKDKGWRYVDTLAGAGGYSLQGAYARKKAEHAQGIALVRARAADAPPLVADYLERVREFNGGDALKQYPGSPAFAHALQRPQDQLSLFELHPTDHRVLSSYLGKEAGCEVRMVDGFEALKSRLPPPTRRGLVLVDPSYELDRDYARVVSVLRESLQRFADGSYLVWYPQVGKVQAAELPKRLRNLTSGPWLHARLTVARPDARGFGMSGSGVFVFNPPHTLHAQLKTVLPWLHEVLKQFDGGGWQLDQKAM
jgi:23S rRNA (adenine2030-N6)-methyltransferase